MTRFGILSTAKINRKVIEGAAGSETVEIAAVASRDQGRADAYAREHGIPKAYGSYDALLADPEIDAVYISLPNGLHCEWSIRALEAGKHVLCEKPMSLSPAEVAAVFDVADANDRFCMEAFMWRHHTQTRWIEELIADDVFGELRFVRAAFSFPLHDVETNVRMQPELAGGSLMDLGCYCVSAIRLVAGEPESAVARHVLSPSGIDIRTAATLTLPGGVLADFQCGMDMPDRSELELIGSEGSITVSDPWHGRQPHLTLRAGDEIEEIEIEPVDAYRLELENLARAIHGEELPLLGRDDAVAQARAIEMIRIAAEREI
ncbi:MAG TPA: Gfo/Idh/MocA family oxidoreductase [Gaiellales bacterium]